MANDILTPVTLWQNIKITYSHNLRVLASFTEDGIEVKQIMFSGRTLESGNVVELYGALATPPEGITKKAIFLQCDFSKPINVALMKKVAADMGAMVLSIDLRGKTDNALFTVYPDEISYANYDVAKNDLYAVPDDRTKTCWFEWILATLYAVDFLFEEEGCEKVALLGFARGSELLWKTAALDKRVSASCFVGGIGWEPYYNKFKFSSDSEPLFDEGVYRWLSGFDAQTYAKYVTSPTLVISETNSKDFDADRAYDTLLRVSDTENAFLYYVVGSDKYLDLKAVSDIKLFLATYLEEEKTVSLPHRPEITAEIKDGGIEVVVSYSMPQLLTGLKLFASEGMYNPSLRDWKEVKRQAEIDENKVSYFYTPDRLSESAFFIAEAEYKCGFTVSSAIISKKFDKDEIKPIIHNKIIYNSKMGAAAFFIPDVEESILDYGVLLGENYKVQVKTGPFGIDGITARTGLKTFMINDACDKPKEGSVLQFDIYTANASVIEVLFIENINTKEERVYSYKKTVDGAKVWNNIIIDPYKALSADNYQLKSFGSINALVIRSGSEYLVNNILWL